MSTSNTPLTFDEAVKSIVSKFSDVDKQNILREPDEGYLCSCLHRKIGRSTRNSWSLWSNSPLKQDMKSLGFTHPDDMSGAIFKSAIRDVKGKPRDILGMVEYYKAHWKKYK